MGNKGNIHCLPAAVSLKVFWQLDMTIQMKPQWAEWNLGVEKQVSSSISLMHIE